MEFIISEIKESRHFFKFLIISFDLCIQSHSMLRSSNDIKMEMLFENSYAITYISIF